MDGYKVNDVAGFPPVGSRRCFVSRKINGVQHITEKLIPLVGKKRKALSCTHSRRILSPSP